MAKKRAAAYKKRPTDVNQLAHFLGAESTKERPATNGDRNTPTKDEISRVMAALGRRGGKIGGKKRMTTARIAPRKRDTAPLTALVALKDGGLESTGNFDSYVTGGLFRLKNESAVLRFDDGWGLAPITSFASTAPCA